jgi:hypothetical protein
MQPKPAQLDLGGAVCALVSAKDRVCGGAVVLSRPVNNIFIAKTCFFFLTVPTSRMHGLWVRNQSADRTNRRTLHKAIRKKRPWLSGRVADLTDTSSIDTPPRCSPLPSCTEPFGGAKKILRSAWRYQSGVCAAYFCCIPIPSPAYIASNGSQTEARNTTICQMRPPPLTNI